MLSRTGAAGAQSLPAPAALDHQRNAGPLERLLEGTQPACSVEPSEGIQSNDADHDNANEDISNS